MLESFLSLVVLSILYGVFTAFCDSKCAKMSFEQMCETSSVITLTWNLLEGHATNDKGVRICVSESYPQLFAKAAKYGLYPTTNNDNGMATLVKKN